MNTARYRFYEPTLLPPMSDDNDIVLEQEQAHHALHVLRVKAGQSVELFDGRGNSMLATVQVANKRQCIVRTHKDTYHTQPPHPTKLTLACAMPKPSRMDEMVNTLTQLGVDMLIPIHTEQSVNELRDNKLTKLGKQVIEACKQCGRNRLMHIHTPTSLNDALTQSADIRLMLDMKSDECPKPSFEAASHVLLFIGPEGGWRDVERERMQAAGVQPWSINPHILRIETAAAASAALVRYGATGASLR